MRALLIVNPNATTTTPAGRDRLARALADRVSLTVAHTTHRGHAAELARSAHADGMDVVVAHGGDGTVNEIVNGLLGTPSERVADPTLPCSRWSPAARPMSSPGRWAWTPIR